MNKRWSISGFEIVNLGLMILLSIIIIFPILYVIAVSFTDSSVYVTNKLILWPEVWSTFAYKYVLTGNGFRNSLSASSFITLVGTPIALIVSSSLAYMLSKTYLPGRSIMLKLVVLTLLFSPGLIPHYLLIRSVGLLDSWWALILPGTASAWTLLVMKSFFQNMPIEIEESAKIDGCNELQIYYRIILPLSKAPLAAFTLFFAVGLWNTYFSAIIYISDSTRWPLQVYLQQMVIAANASQFLDSEMATDLLLQNGGKSIPGEGIKMAAIVLVMTPIIIVYPFLQKYFAQGVMIGSVKG